VPAKSAVCESMVITSWKVKEMWLTSGKCGPRWPAFECRQWHRVFHCTGCCTAAAAPPPRLTSLHGVLARRTALCCTRNGRSDHRLSHQGKVPPAPAQATHFFTLTPINAHTLLDGTTTTTPYDTSKKQPQRHDTRDTASLRQRHQRLLQRFLEGSLLHCVAAQLTRRPRGHSQRRSLPRSHDRRPRLGQPLCRWKRPSFTDSFVGSRTGARS